MKKRIHLLLAALLCLPSLADALVFKGGATPATPTTETVSVNLASTGFTIPAKFMGISEEMADIPNGYLSGSMGASFASLAGMLGPNGLLRIGGTSSDLSTAPALTQALANDIHTVMASMGSGWSLMYGLDICNGNSTLAVTQAGYIINAVGVANIQFQFGNEPPTCSYTQSTYIAAWNSYYSAMSAAYPSALYAGPDAGGATSSLSGYVNALTPGLAGLTSVTFHYYSTFVSGGFTPSQLIACSLKSSLSAGGCSFYTSAQTVFAAGKLQLSETNTAAVQGDPNISNRLVASTWLLNYAMSTAALGYNGMNIHEAFQASVYNPLVLNLGTGTYSAGSIFYGMYLFSKIEGQVTATTTNTGTGTVGSMGTIGANGNANILVVNNDVNKPVVITPAQSNSWSSAKVLILSPGNTGAGCTDASPRLGGAVIGASGAWAGVPATISNGGTFTLLPCGAALVQIQP